ncbi:MAG TPA: BamA/TamA family outer membrane protein [Thermoanaerobaculia bacterium]|nr:BamA/TamA family outer membrane protein [Thermoanaerobaculia bacterium]
MSHRLRHGRSSALLRGTGYIAALLLLAALLPAPAAAQFGKNKIQYQRFKWQIYHSPHFDVYYYAEEEALLQRVVSFAESAYDELSRRLDYQIESSTPLIFYKTHAEFEQNNIQLGFIPEAVGAFATDVRFRMVLPVDLPDAELHELILHELTHIFQYHLLFGGKVSRSLTSQPPTWLVEGMASYYAQDESTSDKMFLRDLVVNDLVPQITKASSGGFLAYRFGHAVFDFMESRWGAQGVLDFLFEYRSTLGGNIDRALRRAFRIEPDDFDADFRRWLREKYLPELVKTGEPSYFGRRFFEQEGRDAEYFAPAVSPSGDLVAALGTPKGDVDVVLFDTRERQPLRNLTKGWSTQYQHLSGQFISDRRRSGSDLAFSADGNWLAVFAKREKGRSLVLVDVIHGGVDRVIDVDVQQPFAPAWSPDGRTIAFAGNRGGYFDIFTLDVQSGTVTNLTNDPRFDGGPRFSPDGRSLVYSSEVGAFQKLFRLELADPSTRRQLTRGDYSDVDPAFTKDGRTLFFTSDRNGFENVYALDLANGEVRQHTNAVTGCFMPQVVERVDGSRALVYVGVWKGGFDLYRGDLDQQPALVETIPDIATLPPAPEAALQRYEPDIQVTINDENKEPYRGFKLFLEDGSAGLGVTSDQLVVSETQLVFSDYLGDKRLFVQLNSVASFTDFNIIYLNLARRLQWGVELFDTRTFFVGITEEGRIQRRSAYRQTGGRGFLVYPLDFYHRVETSLGYVRREYDFQNFVVDPQTNEIIPFIEPRTDTYPEVGLGFVGDTTVEAQWGPVSGRRYFLEGTYAPDVEGKDPQGSINPGSGAITASAILDFRQYVPISRRVQIAFRLFGAASWGVSPNVFYFGGLDTVRGFEFRELVGDRAFYSNLELRFPLLDALVFPFMVVQGIRGRVFLDLGGAWFNYADETFKFWDGDGGRLSRDDLRNRVRGPVSAYGWGFTANLLGLDMNWDFAKRWDFHETFTDGFETTFWIGSRF